MYVRKYLKVDAKDKIVRMVDDVRDEFQEALKEAQWIDAVTKRSAFRKAQSMLAHVGYPSELVDDKKINEYFTYVK